MKKDPPWMINQVKTLTNYIAHSEVFLRKKVLSQSI